MDFDRLNNTELIKAIKLLETLSDRNAIAFMTLKLYHEELRRRCEQVFRNQCNG